MPLIIMVKINLEKQLPCPLGTRGLGRDSMVNQVKKKGGFTVSELETHMKKHGVEVTIAAASILSAIFALIWGGGMLFWSVLLCGIGGALGAVFPKMIHKILASVLHFCTKERITSIIASVLLLFLSLVAPFITFLALGCVGGKGLSLGSHKAFGNDLLHD